MKIKLFEGFDKEALENEVNRWLTGDKPLSNSMEVMDIKIACKKETSWEKITIMVVYK